MPPQRVLILNNRGVVYGAEKSLVELARCLQRVELIVAVPDGGSLAPTIANHGTRVVHHRIPRKQESGQEVLVSSELNRLLTEHPGDVLHLNKAFWYLPQAREITACRGLQLVVHVRGHVELDREMLLSLASCDAVVAVSQSVRQHLLLVARRERLEGALAPRLHMVHNGRTLADYAFCEDSRTRVHARLGIERDEVVVALFGYFTPIKGQLELVEIASRLCGGNSKLRFLLVGDVVNHDGFAYRKAVLRRIGQLELNGKVIAPGFLPASQVLSAVDVVVNLSRTEGLPGILIEAMAAGRAIVARAVGGTQEVIGPSECGYCVTNDEPAPIEEILSTLAERPALRRRLGDKARARAHELFSSKKAAMAMEEIYESLCR